MAETIFSRIIRGEIPCHRVYEDEHVLAFLDIMPLSRGHTLVIPKEEAAKLDRLSDDAAAAIGRVLPRLCRAVCAATGASAYNLLQNNGRVARIIVVPVAKALVGFIAKKIAQHLVKFVVQKIPNMVLDAASKASWFQKATHWVSNKIILPALRGALSVVTPFRKGFTGMLGGIEAVGRATGLVASNLPARKAPSAAELALPPDQFQKSAMEGPKPISDDESLAVLREHSKKVPGAGSDPTSILDSLKGPQDGRLRGVMRLSSSHSLYPASKAMDGDPNTFAHSNRENRPWWEVTFDREYSIGRIVIWNRHNCCQERLNNSDVFVYDSAGRQRFSKHIPRAGRKIEISVPNVRGRRGRLQLRGSNYLNFGEIAIYGERSKERLTISSPPKPPAPPIIGLPGPRAPAPPMIGMPSPKARLANLVARRNLNWRNLRLSMDSLYRNMTRARVKGLRAIQTLTRSLKGASLKAMSKVRRCVSQLFGLIRSAHMRLRARWGKPQDFPAAVLAAIRSAKPFVAAKKPRDQARAAFEALQNGARRFLAAAGTVSSSLKGLSSRVDRAAKAGQTALQALR